jgi:hypothetical protein
VAALADGRRVLSLELPEITSKLTYASLVCTETAGEGGLEQPSPARDDTPGTATLWAPYEVKNGTGRRTLQQVLPLAEPGRALWFSAFKVDGAFSINGADRMPSGRVALLTQMSQVVDRRYGPAMQVREYDAATLAVGAVTKFDNLLELGTAQSRYLVATDLRVLPDGRFRADTEEGNFPIGGATAQYVPWSRPSRWGRFGSKGAAQVSHELIGASQILRWSRSLDESAALCSTDSLPNERCVAYPGQLQDWGIRDSKLYVLDRWRGEVLERDYYDTSAPFRTVMTGLSLPEHLWVPMDDDPGIYVVDTHLYRFVPGPTPARRP